MSVKTRPLTDEELRKYTALLNSDKIPDRLRPVAACVALCLGTGGRISEILGMRNRDIFADGKPLPRISRNVLKRRKQIRTTCAFPWDWLGEPVIRWHEIRGWYGEDALFIDRTRRDCWKRQRELLELAGIPPQRIAFHGLRKTALNLFYRRFRAEAGGDCPAVWRKVQKQACHARIDTTLGYLDHDDALASDETILSAFSDVLGV